MVRHANHPFRYEKFLSSNAQDFIEDLRSYAMPRRKDEFLSSNAQDFIEDRIQEPVGVRVT